MKNKKSLYILVPAVLIVWALIIYKILDFTQSPEIYNNQLLPIDTTQLDSNDTMEIPFIGDYRDPFLGRGKVIKSVIDNKKANQNRNIKNKPVSYKKQAPIVKYINWPKIDYNGMILSKETNEKLALINLNRKNYLMQINHEIKGCKLLEIYEDSIKLKYQDVEKMFYK